jgi:hypothetical protein
MKKYEYKTLELKLKGAGIFGPKQAHGFEDALTREGSSGWRYVDTLLETGAYGEAARIKLVFERELE